MLSCINLTLKANNEPLFKNLSFSLLPGSLTYLKGENGSGKTTLLRTFAGIAPVTEGEIYYRRQKLQDLPKPFANYVGHELGLKNDLTVMENIEFWAQVFDSYQMVPASVFFFNLQDILAEKVGNLSAGNKKKIALARMMACNSDLWLLDEITTNLDENNRTLLNRAIHAKVSSGGIVIMTSHLNDNPFPYAREINLGDFA